MEICLIEVIERQSWINTGAIGLHMRVFCPVVLSLIAGAWRILKALSCLDLQEEQQRFDWKRYVYMEATEESLIFW